LSKKILIHKVYLEEIFFCTNKEKRVVRGNLIVAVSFSDFSMENSPIFTKMAKNIWANLSEIHQFCMLSLKACPGYESCNAEKIS